MGVYIPNIKIPEKCSKCRNTGLKFAIDELGLKCPEQKEIFGPTEADIKGIRRPDCPLVPVTEPHGRLGDLDELRKKISERKRPTFSSGEDGSKDRVKYLIWNSMIIAVNESPAIIPAEEGNG